MSGVEPKTAVAALAALLVVVSTTAMRALADDEPIEDGGCEALSIGEGVFTAAQAQRGQAVYEGPCGRCHGKRLDGAPIDPDMFSTPPVAGAKFLSKWNGRTLAALYDYTRATMPENNPGFLSEQEFIDIIAYMLSVGGLPSGRGELEPDRKVLARIVVRQAP